MKQLENIIRNLLSDQYYAVTMVNRDTGKTIVRNITGDEMESEAGSVEEYFNRLVIEYGVKSIAIQPRRKNGNNFRDYGMLMTFDLNPATENPSQPPPVPQHQVHQAQVMPTDPFGLAGAFGGLNAPMALYHHMDYPKLEAKAVRLEDENTRLKDEITKLKEEALETKWSDAKASGNKEMLKGITDIVAPIAQALILSKTGGAIHGLGMPVDTIDEELSAVQQELLNLIKETPDHYNSYLSFVVVGMKNNAFAGDLMKLLQQHNLIPV